MNARRVSAAADLIHRSQENGKRTAAGVAADLDAACMLQSPEVAAELAAYRALELTTVEGRVSAKCENPHHPVWLRNLDDKRGCPWCALDKAHDDLTGSSLSLYEEEQETARLRLALKSAQRGRREMRSQRDAVQRDFDTAVEGFNASAMEITALRARVAELEAERARYVGAEPTIAEEMAYLSRCLDSVLAWCEKAEEKAPELVAEVRAAAEGMVERTSYPPALPWARLMDDEDRAEFLADLADAVGHRNALVEIEDACARWRVIAEAQHAHNTAPGPGEETTR